MGSTRFRDPTHASRADAASDAAILDASRQRLTVLRVAREKVGKSPSVRFLGGPPITIGGAGVSFRRVKVAEAVAFG